MQLGDVNTIYFYASMKYRSAQNQITKLLTTAGKWIHTESYIKEEITGFYKKMLGTAVLHLLDVHPGISSNGTVLNRSQQLQLVSPISNEEVHALQDIDDSKSPGGDGFNAFSSRKHGVW